MLMLKPRDPDSMLAYHSINLTLHIVPGVLCPKPGREQERSNAVQYEQQALDNSVACVEGLWGSRYR